MKLFEVYSLQRSKFHELLSILFIFDTECEIRNTKCKFKSTLCIQNVKFNIQNVNSILHYVNFIKSDFRRSTMENVGELLSILFTFHTLFNIQNVNSILYYVYRMQNLTYKM